MSAQERLKIPQKDWLEKQKETVLGAGMCTAEVTIMSESELWWYYKNKLEAEQNAGCSAAPFFIGGTRSKRQQHSVKH